MIGLKHAIIRQILNKTIKEIEMNELQMKIHDILRGPMPMAEEGVCARLKGQGIEVSLSEVAEAMKDMEEKRWICESPKTYFALS